MPPVPSHACAAMHLPCTCHAAHAAHACHASSHYIGNRIPLVCICTVLTYHLLVTPYHDGLRLSAGGRVQGAIARLSPTTRIWWECYARLDAKRKVQPIPCDIPQRTFPTPRMARAAFLKIAIV